MKVIKPGRHRSNLAVQWNCLNCAAVIESLAAEGREVSDPRDGDAIIFACPECGHENWINANKFNQPREEGR